MYVKDSLKIVWKNHTLKTWRSSTHNTFVLYLVTTKYACWLLKHTSAAMFVTNNWSDEMQWRGEQEKYWLCLSVSPSNP